MRIMKILNTIIIYSLLVIALFNLFLFFYPFQTQGKPVIIPPRSNSIQVASTLKENGIIRNKTYFLVAGQMFKVFHNIRAGEYDFGSRASTWMVLKKLSRGEIAIYRITIPEGWTISDTGKLLSQSRLVDPGEFFNLVNDADFTIDSYKFPKNLEGYLFPDTYYFMKGVNIEKTIIVQMLSQFKKKIVDVYGAEIKAKGYSLEKVIILASLVEKEAVVDHERPVIAKVFYNRLRKKMLLQCDPTVRYALGKFSGKLSRKDLGVKSPFNTYLHAGLPPYPICNPGIASIKAVLRPADTDYLYFVSKNDGTHYFAKSYEEHKEAKKKYQGS